MTEENPQDKPLKLYKTAPGNHARRENIGSQKGWYNIRQIEVIKDEILGKNKDTYMDAKKVGIICPYRKQVSETNKLLGIPELEVDTVHKFQGREKDAVIFTTVADEINEFIDDPNLINVAVSRAVKELVVITSNKVFKKHGINDEYAGAYRDQQVIIAGAKHIPPEPFLIKEQMENLIKWYEGEGGKLHPVLRARTFALYI